MKILHVLIGLADSWGGPPRALATIARAQAARGDDVTVLPCIPTPPPPTLAEGISAQLTVLAPPATGSMKFYSPALKRALRDAARGCDIVHVHGTWRYHLLGAASVADEYGIPYVVRPAGNLGAVCIGSKWFLKRPYFELFERRVINRAAALHCTSRKEVDEIAPLRLRTRTFIVPPPVEVDLKAGADGDGELLQLCPMLREKRDGLIVFMGRINQIKSLDVLLEAFIGIARDFPGWQLVLAGWHEDSVLAGSLLRRAAEAGLANRVSLPGMVRNAAKAALLQRASIFAQPSQHENFGISVAEALQFGAPCVVSHGVALAGDIVDAGAGLACESRPEPFAAALRTLMSDESLRQLQSENARRLAQRFSPHSIANELDREYRVCLSGRCAPCASAR